MKRPQDTLHHRKPCFLSNGSRTGTPLAGLSAYPPVSQLSLVPEMTPVFYCIKSLEAIITKRRSSTWPKPSSGYDGIKSLLEIFVLSRSMRRIPKFVLQTRLMQPAGVLHFLRVYCTSPPDRHRRRSPGELIGLRGSEKRPIRHCHNRQTVVG
jgi:hypothetical protein